MRYMKAMTVLAIVIGLVGCFQQIDLKITLSSNTVRQGDILTFTVTSDPPTTTILEEAYLDGNELKGFQYYIPYQLDTANLAVGNHALKIRVVDIHFDGGYAIAQFEVMPGESNRSPQVVIDGSETVVSGPDSIAFTAEASDYEDGDLSSYLEWSVDNLPVIIGPTLTYDFLEAKTYTVTAKATDSDNNTGQDSVTVVIELGEPGLVITNLSEFGDPNGTVTVLATNVDPSECKACTYIEAAGPDVWWNKPTYQNPCVNLNSDGTATIDITTGGADQCAAAVKVGLFYKDYEPQICSPCLTEPAMTDALAVAHAERDAPQRIIYWADDDWYVKGNAICAEGPGLSIFDQSSLAVFVDENGFLHLIIRCNSVLGAYTSSEVYNTESKGYGTYRTVIKITDSLFDPYIVAAWFLWDYTAYNDNYKEIDFEISDWARNLSTNAQFVLQPCNSCPGCGNNCSRFTIDPNLEEVSIFLIWENGRAEFRIYSGNHANELPPESQLIHAKVFTSGVPEPGNEAVHYNFWQFMNHPPSDLKDHEYIIKDFGYSPQVIVFPTCGNGRIEIGEECDDGNVINNDSCSSTCRTETPFAICGNNVTEDDEQCDGSDLNNTTCQILGFDSGTLTCASNCQFNTTNCRIEEECGIKIIQANDGYVNGTVYCYDPRLYGIAVYIKVRGGWWTKPYWAWPVTEIADDKTWSCDIITGGVDNEATEVAAFLIDLTYTPPSCSGHSTLPQELYDNALEYDTAPVPYN